jgi:hypothetical protein
VRCETIVKFTEIITAALRTDWSVPDFIDTGLGCQIG